MLNCMLRLHVLYGMAEADADGTATVQSVAGCHGREHQAGKSSPGMAGISPAHTTSLWVLQGGRDIPGSLWWAPMNDHRTLTG